MAKLLELDHVNKSYPAPAGGKPEMVLSDISFSIMPGELVAVIGPSGSGKTTLLNIIGSLDKPTAGRVLFQGENIALLDEKRQAQYRRESVGIVFQSHNLLNQCTAKENILLGVLAGGKITDADHKRADELLAAVGLSQYGNHFPGQLSGGQCQRVALARAFINRPAIMLPDEPTGSLDSHNAELVIDMLCKLSTQQKTAVILVTHDMKIASKMARHIELNR